MVYNGTYTIQNRETGKHRTFRIRTQKENARFAPSKRILSLLTGPDNTRDFTGFAFVDNGKIFLWQKKDHGDWRGYTRLLIDILFNDGKQFGQRYSVRLEKRCIRCNRKLTTPESIDRGFGPECAGKI